MGYSAIIKPPFVTVLMTVYNGLPYLPGAIESVLVQTFSDFEFLIVDDASTDNSVACIRSYADPRIRLVRNETNLGQTRSLNRGLQLALGRHVARLDQDDVCLPQRLEKQVVFLQHRPEVAVVGTLMLGMDESGNKRRRFGRYIDDYPTFLALLLVGDCPLAHPSVMFRREVVMKLGGYDDSFSPAEDYHLWSKLAMQRHGACVIGEPLLLYRVHKKQQSHFRGSLQRKSLQRGHENMISLLCNGGPSRILSLLLRLDRTFWKECRSKGRFAEVLLSLEHLFVELQRMLKISDAELAQVKGIVYRRLGPGSRRWRALMAYPGIVSFPVFFTLAPFLTPGVRRVSSWLGRQVR